MKKAILAFTFMACSVGMSAHADWEAVKEKAHALGDEVVGTTKEAWDDGKDWSSDVVEDAGQWSKEARKKGSDWIDAGGEKLDKILTPKAPDEARDALDNLSG